MKSSRATLRNPDHEWEHETMDAILDRLREDHTKVIGGGIKALERQLEAFGDRIDGLERSDV